MLLRANAEHEIDPAASLMIGDAASDVAAAKQAGVRGVRYAGGSLADCVREALASAQQEEGGRTGETRRDHSHAQ